MQIKDWLYKEVMTYEKFGKGIGCARQSVWVWVNYVHLPSHKTIEKIERFTKGEVTYEDFRQGMKEKRAAENG